jgi:hypothetical protein
VIWSGIETGQPGGAALRQPAGRSSTTNESSQQGGKQQESVRLLLMLYGGTLDIQQLQSRASPRLQRRGKCSVPGDTTALDWLELRKRVSILEKAEQGTSKTSPDAVKGCFGLLPDPYR